jgi:hypothetical protein
MVTDLTANLEERSNALLEAERRMSELQSGDTAQGSEATAPGDGTSAKGTEDSPRDGDKAVQSGTDGAAAEGSAAEGSENADAPAGDAQSDAGSDSESTEDAGTADQPAGDTEEAPKPTDK